MKDKAKKQFTISLSDEGIKKVPRQEEENKQRYSAWFYLGAFGNIGLTIASPIVLGTIVGYIIDNQRQSGTTFTLIGITFGTIVSLFGFFRIIQNIIKGNY